MDRNMIRDLAADLNALSDSNNLTTAEGILLRRLGRDASAIEDVASQLDEVTSDRNFYKRQTEELRIQLQHLEAKVAQLSTSTEALARFEHAASVINGDFFVALKHDGKLQEFLTYIAAGQYINAIKQARMSIGCGLREGKDYVEAIRDFRLPPPSDVSSRERPESTQDNQQSRDDVPF